MTHTQRKIYKDFILLFRMAQTRKDFLLHLRIENLAKQIKGSDKDVIYQISAICGISSETARRHYNSFKAQQTLIGSGFIEDCNHIWSVPCSTPGGLVKECLLCHKTAEVNA